MNAKDMPGVTAPLGFFDPLGFAKKADSKTLAKYRESELKHGRVAMLAVLGVLGAERWHPLYDGKFSGNPLEALSQVPSAGWAQIIAFIGIIEYTQVSAAKSPTYKAGDLYGFNSLFADEKDPSWVDFQNRELNNGRAAMFGILGEIVHSQLTGKGPIELLATEPLHSQFLNGHAQCANLFCQ
jgi:Chlorophyll A-B binding protein